MTSRSHALVGLLAFVTCFAASACGRVNDLSVPQQPLLVVHGHVDLASLSRPNPSAALIGSLVWAGLPTVNPVCLEFSSPDIAAACPDPYGVFEAEIEEAAPVDANGDFDLTLFHLPAARVSIGDQTTRIAYGSLLVIEDVDGNGQPTFPGGVRRRDRNDPPPSSNAPDRIVAASFYSLHAAQQRVVFREGGFVSPSFFYPEDCGEPPTGFSILSAPPYTGTPAAPTACIVASVDTRVDVPAVAPLDPTEGLGLLCRPVQRDATVRQPQTDEEPPGKHVCLSPTVLAAVFNGLCPSLRSYALRGCAQESQCPAPEWDITAAPPPWWPCH
jgi:hypothetical protein